MATLAEKIRAERSGRAMLERGGVRPPDHVEYGYTCIRFFWDEEKVVLVIDMDEPPEGFETVGAELADAGRELAGDDPGIPYRRIDLGPGAGDEVGADG
jgi:hypothetical protein